MTRHGHCAQRFGDSHGDGRVFISFRVSNGLLPRRQEHHIGAHCRKEPGSFSSPSAHHIVLTTACRDCPERQRLEKLCPKSQNSLCKTKPQLWNRSNLQPLLDDQNRYGPQKRNTNASAAIAEAAAHRPTNTPMDQQTDRQTHRSTDPQIDRQTDRQRQGQTVRNIRAALQILQNSTRSYRTWKRQLR